MPDVDPLEAFGRQFVATARDGTIDGWFRTFDGAMTFPGARAIAETYGALDPEQQAFARQLVVAIVDEAVHNSLWAIEQLDWVSLLATNRDTGAVADVKEDSGGLTAILEDDDGWLDRYAQFPPSVLLESDEA